MARRTLEHMMTPESDHRDEILPFIHGKLPGCNDVVLQDIMHGVIVHVSVSVSVRYSLEDGFRVIRRRRRRAVT